MIKISNGLKNNSHLATCQDTIFTVLVRDALQLGNFSEQFLKTPYVHGLLQYPEWKPTSDIFCFINDDELLKLQNNESFFVFDSSTEGFSPVKHFPFFDMLYHNCEKYNVDPSRVIYVSSNLQDEENMIKYAAERNKKPINVFSFISFEKVVRDTTLTLETEEEKCYSQFEGKYFSSLSRVIRYHRTIATFLLCQDPVSEKALISHDKFPTEANPEMWLKNHQLDKEYTPKHVKRWFKTLPRTVDKTNFSVNWALNKDYYTIHRRTLFQIVNETLVDNYQDTSLFYSEKTFRPISCFQPFVIYGQKGCNRYLKNIGYKTYEDWFDLSFDDEDDDILRYKKLLASVKDICNYLDSLDRDKQIEWRFKNKKLLHHNFTVMSDSAYSRNKLFLFLKNLDETTNNTNT